MGTCTRELDDNRGWGFGFCFFCICFAAAALPYAFGSAACLFVKGG